MTGAEQVSDASDMLLVPGQIVAGHGEVTIAPDTPADTALIVVNAADRPIQVGSHFHFAEANPALQFDRAAAWGKRLAIPAGTSVRFEPGIERSVVVTPLRGRRIVPGLRGEAGGALDGARQR